MSAALLFSQMEPPVGEELAFHRWYDTVHIPPRMALPGFAAALRYVAVQGTPWHLACYHLSDARVLDTEAYRALKAEPDPTTAHMLAHVTGFTRYIADLISDTGPVAAEHDRLSVVAFDVPAPDLDAFEDWYADEHVPLLMKADGWLRVRRYRVRPGFEGPPWTHFALHELRDETALDSPERAAARDTPRRSALAARPWFGRSGRWLYRPIAAAFSGGH